MILIKIADGKGGINSNGPRARRRGELRDAVSRRSRDDYLLRLSDRDVSSDVDKGVSAINRSATWEDKEHCQREYGTLTENACTMPHRVLVIFCLQGFVPWENWSSR